MRRVLFIILLTIHVPCIFAGQSHAGDPVRYSRADYVEIWKMVALQKMFDHGIPASITLAQGILESGNGNSTLAREANNHFGIKCHGWDGPGYYMDDDARNECFRVYENAEQSFEDHSKFLMQKRYAGLFNLKVTDYKGWAKGLKKAGYATNPQYATRLIKIIEDMQLYKLDRITYKEYLAMGGKKKGTVIASSAPQKKEKIKKAPEAEEEELIFVKGRKISISKNNIKYLVAEDGDTYEKIAADLNLGRWQILKYNDLDRKSPIKTGERIYIQPKRGKAAKSAPAVHVIQPGESYREISQMYGIKLKKLLKRNRIEPNTYPRPGEKVRLR